MKQPETIAAVNLGNIRSETQMGLDQSGFVHLMNVLSNLYSDRPMAVVREYSTNAIDSHIEAGNTAPIEVALLDEGNGTMFIVQDRGVGMSVDDLTDTYSLYGRSTKRDSDATNGLLGLGSKAGFTYAQQFNVIAVKNGVKTFAVVTKDEQGIGTIRVLDTCATGEPNGVRIEVPVEERDVYKFRNAAEELYRWWERGTVLFNGAEPECVRDDQDLLWVDDDIAIDFNESREGFVVMGNVAYPFEHGDDFGIYAWVPMGAITFTPSREGLLHTDLTDDTIESLTDYVAARLPGFVQRFMDETNKPVDRVRVLKQWGDFAPELVKDFRDTHGVGPRVDVTNDEEEKARRELFVDDKRYASPIWRYQTNTGKRRARSNPTFRTWFDLADEHCWIITDYPFKELSPSNCARLKQWDEEVAEAFAEDFLLYASGVDLGVVEGRGKVVAWDEVFTRTKKAPSERRPREHKPTVYSVYRDGKEYVETVGEIVAASGGGVVLYCEPPRAIRRGRGYSYIPASIAKDISKRHPVTVVELWERQWPKFLKVVERAGVTAAPAIEYDRNAKQIAASRITDEDRLGHYLASFRSENSWLVEHLDRLQDPELRYALTTGVEQSERVVEAIRLNGGMEPRELKGKVNGDGLWEPFEHDLTERLAGRYPLVMGYYGRQYIRGDRSARDDALLYINSKYIQWKALGGQIDQSLVEGER